MKECQKCRNMRGNKHGRHVTYPNAQGRKWICFRCLPDDGLDELPKTLGEAEELADECANDAREAAEAIERAEADLAAADKALSKASEEKRAAEVNLGKLRHKEQSARMRAQRTKAHAQHLATIESQAPNDAEPEPLSTDAATN